MASTFQRPDSLFICVSPNRRGFLQAKWPSLLVLEFNSTSTTCDYLCSLVICLWASSTLNKVNVYDLAVPGQGGCPWQQAAHPRPQQTTQGGCITAADRHAPLATSRLPPRTDEWDRPGFNAPECFPGPISTTHSNVSYYASKFHTRNHLS